MLSNRRDEVSGLIARRQPTRSLPELAYEAIVQAIFDRVFQPGTHLNIDMLAQQLDMSNTPVREALTRAVAQRLVIQDTNRGFTVAPLLKEQEYQQLFDIRHLLEMHAFEIMRPEEAAIAHLSELVAQMPAMEHGAAYSDFREFNQADREFHHTLITMSHNPFLIRAWEDLYFHLHMGRLYAGAGVVDFGYALPEHTAIAQALQAGDREAAAKAASYHIQQARQRLRSLLPATTDEEQEQ
ncbi:MAG TPA: GntR family transcriptional regulator [Ktedonobacteraceae bacterium]